MIGKLNHVAIAVPDLEAAVLYLLIVALAAVPVSFVSGIVDWKTRFKGVRAPIFYKKIVLAVEPDHIEANRFLSMLLNTEGRRWESTPHTFSLVRLEAFSIQDLILMPVDRFKKSTMIVS